VSLHQCEVCRRDFKAEEKARKAEDVEHKHPGHPMSIFGLSKISYDGIDLVYVKKGDELKEMDRLRSEWDKEHGL
jgi:hypothetical protein